MNETQLLSIIAGGEKEDVDFKRSLHLKTNNEKAEFAKDISAIANSTDSKGYYLVGVNNDKRVVGTDKLEEERIQQIINTNLTPAPIITCDHIPIAAVGFLSVCVIEIRPTEKPHTIARAIGNLKKDQVFVRRGTTTAESSPHELFRMKKDENVSQYTKAGETHLRLKNYDNAITSFSRVIENSPTYYVFMKRAEAYLGKREQDRGEWDKLSKRALKDYSDAIEIAPSNENIVNQIRRKRYEAFSRLDYYDKEERRRDFESKIDELKGEERLNYIFFAINECVMPWDEYAISLLEEIIATETRQIEAQRLLAEVHLSNKNYGLALQLTEETLQLLNKESEDPEAPYEEEKLQKMRLDILFDLKKYTEADSVARLILLKWGKVHFPNPNANLSDYLKELALEHKYSSTRTDYRDYEPEFLIKMFTAYLARTPGKEIMKKTRLEDLEISMPGIQRILINALGDEYWNRIQSNEELLFSFQPQEK